MTRRVTCKVAYEGTAFSGYQVQPGKRTVQNEIEQALQSIHKGKDIRIQASGRTDAGVHAYGQIIHFDSPLAIREQQWPNALNACLPNDVLITDASYVESDFHSRFSATEKEYRYRVLLRKTADVFRRNFVYHIPYSLDIQSMQAAASELIGTFDFSSFCASNSSIDNKTRSLYQLKIELVQDELVFTLNGNGFLYNMVRIIVGTLIEIGSGKRHPEEMKDIRDAKQRKRAGKTAPAQGLYLWSVGYEEDLFKNN